MVASFPTRKALAALTAINYFQAANGANQTARSAKSAKKASTDTGTRMALLHADLVKCSTNPANAVILVAVVAALAATGTR